MKLVDAGLKLSRTYEGLSLVAYPDPGSGGDPWTIGFGHTSAAGAPHVQRGMRLSGVAEAIQIHTNDMLATARRIAPMIKRALNDNQFSAMAVFANNIGEGKFQRSNVLRAINAGDLASVPRKLAMWCNAAGHRMAGLVKRRHAEGLLFMKPVGATMLFQEELPLPTEAEIAEMQGVRHLIDVPMGTPAFQSSTVWSAIGGFATTLGAGITYLVQQAMGAAQAAQNAFWNIMPFQEYVPEKYWPWIILVVLAGAFAAYIINDRLKKARDEDL